MASEFHPDQFDSVQSLSVQTSVSKSANEVPLILKPFLKANAPSTQLFFLSP